MQRHQREQLKGKIEELIRFGFNSENPPQIDLLSKRLARLIRPTSSSVQDHSSAIKQKLRETIISQSVGGNNGPINMAIFEKECEAVTKVNNYMLNSYLCMLEQLKVTAVANNYINHDYPALLTPVRNDSKQVENTPPKEEVAVKAVVPSPNLEGFHGPTVLKFESVIPDEESKLLSEELSHIWVPKEVENKLLRDLLFTFQGINSKHIRYDPRNESYVVDPSLKLPTSVRDSVLSLCELAWLFSKVVSYCNSAEASSQSRGLVVQAFGYSLQEELHDYYRLLAILEQELGKSVMGAASSSEQRSEELPLMEHNHRLSLLRMRTWLQEPIDRMCLLAKVVDAVGPLTGGALASRINGHLRHGDKSVVHMVTRIMNAICAPLYFMLTRWILFGDLKDPYEEFFVSRREEGHDDGMLNVWLDTYQLRHSMLPSFLSLHLANKILVIGKSINFIRLCSARKPLSSLAAEAKDGENKKPNSRPSSALRVDVAQSDSEGIAKFSPSKRSPRNTPKRDSLRKGMPRPSVANALGYHSPRYGDAQNTIDWFESDLVPSVFAGSGNQDNGVVLDNGDEGDDIFLHISDEIEAQLHDLKFGSEEKLEEIVTSISDVVDRKLMSMMFRDFHIVDHLLACKKFLLLGQGDFVTCLMDSMAPELQKSATKIYRHTLTGILEGALRASNAQFIPSGILNRVLVRVLEPVKGDTGWEVFALDYAVDMPLNAVIHGEAIAKYRQAFHMLWRLKRVEWSLSSAWKMLMTLSHSAWRGNGRDGRSAWRREFPNLLPVLHRCTVSRGRMVYVINNLCAFIMFEVLESAWKKLLDGMRNSKNLDEVIRVHDAYLNEILDRALLTSQHENLNNQIQRLLQCILRFCEAESSLITDATVAMSRRRRVKDDASSVDSRKRAKGGIDRSNISMVSLPVEQPGSCDGVPVSMVLRVDEAVRDYDYQFERLMMMLREQGELAGDIVKYLTFRLDFNEYYSATMASKQAFSGNANSPRPNIKSTLSLSGSAANEKTSSPNVLMEGIYKDVDDTFVSSVSSMTASSFASTPAVGQTQMTTRVSSTAQMRNSVASASANRTQFTKK